MRNQHSDLQIVIVRVLLLILLYSMDAYLVPRESSVII